jgi:HEPN domain-containing protein
MNFDVERTINYWHDGAIYDLNTAESLIIVEKYLYALFFGHLALEKLLKALVVKETREHAPYTHSLPLLASKLKLDIPQDILEKLADFMEFYLEARYPNMQKSFYDKCSKEFTESNFAEVKRVFKWLEKTL